MVKLVLYDAPLPREPGTESVPWIVALVMVMFVHMV